jgi:hypothetical protein
MSFPPATEMFQFAGFASPAYGFSKGYPYGWVAPFGDPGINDRSHLPRAFRSVPRPSSPLSAKASTRCPYFALERHTQRQGPRQYQTRYRENQNQLGAANFSFSEDTTGPHTLLPAAYAGGAVHGLPLRSHNSLLYNCHQHMLSPPPRGMLRRQLGSSCRVLTSPVPASRSNPTV